MKLSKRLTALFAAVLMAVTVFTSAVPAYAAQDTGAVKVGNYAALCTLSSNNKRETRALTSSLHSFDYIYAYVVVARVDNNGDNAKYIGKTAEKYNSTTSGEAKLTTTSSYYFKNISSVHLVEDNSTVDVIDLELHY